MVRLLTPSKLVIAFVSVVTVGTTLKILHLAVVDQSQSGTKNCKAPKDVQKNSLAIAEMASHILNLHKIEHFLCYESLWGALMNQNLLEWERRVQLCALSENLNKLDEVFFMRQFQKRNLYIDYDSKTGQYSIWKESRDNGLVEMNLFERVSGEKNIRRIGWKHRLLPPTSDFADSFPDFLVQPVLPTAKLDSCVFPVPREGIELQKYHYKDSWWKASRPSNC